MTRGSTVRGTIIPGTVHGTGIVRTFIHGIRLGITTRGITAAMASMAASTAAIAATMAAATMAAIIITITTALTIAIKTDAALVQAIAAAMQPVHQRPRVQGFQAVRRLRPALLLRPALRLPLRPALRQPLRPALQETAFRNALQTLRA